MAIRFLSTEYIDGSLGVGRSPSTAKLEVAGEARVYTGSNLGYWGVDSGNSYVYLGTNSSNYGLSFQTSGTERMRITSGGNVGINITPAGSVALDVKELDASNDLILGLTAGTGSRAQIRSVVQTSTESALSFHTTLSSSTQERFRILNTGAFSLGNSGTNYGTSGQVLTSNGNAAPYWTTPTTGTVKGTGTATRVAFWSASDTLSSNADLYWDNSNDRLGIGTTSPDRSLDVEGNGMAIFGTGGYTELMLRGQVEGTGTVRNVGSWHWSIRSDIGGDNDDLKLVRFVTGSYVGIAMQVQNSTGDIFFGNTVVNPATGFSNQRGLGYDQSTGNLEAASTSGTAMTIGRNESSDGQILQLRKESNIKHSFGSTTSYLLGNVGIGTTSPQSKLHISTSTTNAPIRLQNDNGSGSTANYVLQTDSSGLGNNGFGIYDVAQSAYRFVINGSGKVGIGTTNPQNQFVIKEGSNVDMEFGSESSGCFIQAYNRTTSAWGYLRFIAGGGEQMRIHTNGNVGIGNTSPTYKLSVNHGASAGGGVTTVANFSAGTGSSSGDGAQINLNNWGDNYGGFIRTVNTQGTPNYLNPKMEFGLNYNNYLPADMITRMTILGNGNVGIGTGSPPESLEISGNMAIRDTHKIYFNHNTNTNRYIGASSANDLDIAADDDINYRSNYNRFFNGSTEFARLSSSTNSWIATGSNGKLGINKTNPAYNLDVTGSIFCTSSYVRASTAPDVWYSNNNNGTYTQTVLYMNQSNSSNTDLNGYFFERGRISNSSTAEIRRWVVGARGGQKQMVLDGPGTLTVAGDVVAYGSPSDKTLKKDIKPIENALSKIQDLEGVTFTWKDPSITNIVNDIGFIAQDVKKVLPTLVRENENGKLSMRHQGVIPILVEAIKELTARVEKLENKNCACKE